MSGGTAIQDPGLDAVDTGEDIEEIVEESPRTIGWHWHRFTVWGEVFSSNSAGLMGAFTGGVSGPWWQSRSCVRCNYTQRRRVELREDRSS